MFYMYKKTVDWYAETYYAIHIFVRLDVLFPTGVITMINIPEKKNKMKQKRIIYYYFVCIEC